MGKKLIRGINDLETLYPEIAKEWHPTKNGSLTPRDVTASSKKKVWWFLPYDDPNTGRHFDFEWEAAIYSRQENGCPFISKCPKQAYKGFNDLETLYPDISAEWDYSKNGEIKPSNILSKSNKKVWWVCQNGHSYESQVSSRTLGHTGCPYCAGQKPIIGENDFKTSFPSLATEWDYEKNYPIRPENILKRSGKKFWWICSNGHSYQATPDARAFGNTGCPYCSHKKLLKGFNDLETTNPEVSKDWDYEKNYPIVPSDIFAGSLKKYWWICPKCGLSYQASVGNRTNRHSGCPKCGIEEGKALAYKTILKNRGSFAERHPELLVEWDYNKNLIKPEEVSFSSRTKVWWVCPKGHSYEASVEQRHAGNGCPYCSNHRLLRGFNDFATIHPDLIEEWDYEKNGDLKPEDFIAGSHNEVWWKCEFGHSWKSALVERHNGSGCPECSKYLRTSFPEQAIYFYVSKVFPEAINGDRHLKVELDIYLPSKSIGIEYDGENWHQDFKKDIRKNHICEKHGIHLIRVREKGCPDMESTPWVTIYKLSDTYTLDQIITSIIESLDESHKLISINIDDDSNQILASYKHQLRANSFAYQCPDLAEEWHPTKNLNLKPTMFPKTSTQQIWWKGKCGHEWVASITNRVSGGKCPICRAEEIKKSLNERKKINSNETSGSMSVSESRGLYLSLKKNPNVIVGVNDLATINPDLAKEWDYENNEGLTPTDVLGNYGDMTYSWICSKGHRWKAQIKSRMKGTGCPYCSGKLVLSGFNDFVTICPNLLKEWDYEKNTFVDPHNIGIGFSKKVWWICPEGHSYQALIHNRQKAGCPYCSGRYPIEGVNDLATLNPEMLKFWDYEKNDVLPSQLKPKSNRKVWWKCPDCGYEWEAAPSNRINHPNCPRCSKSISTKVMNIDTGEVFSSMTKAAEKYGKSHSAASQISNCGSGRQEKAFGFRWKIVE